MLLPADMRKTLVGVHKSYQEKVVLALHEAGIMEITDIWESKSDISAILDAGERRPEIGICAEYTLKINRILDVLREHRETEENILRDLFFPAPKVKIQVGRRDLRELFTEAEAVIHELEEVISINNELSAILDRSQVLKMQQESVRLLVPFGFDLGYMGESKLLYITAALIEPSDQEYFADQIEKRSLKDLVILKKEIDEHYVTVIATLSENRERLDELLRDPHFRKIDIEGLEGEPSAVITRISDDLKGLETTADELEGALRSIDAEWKDKLLALHEELEIEKERVAVLSKLGRTKDTVVIGGWVAAKDGGKIQALCEEVTDGHVFCDFGKPPENPDGVPIKYDNPPWLQPFEFITTMFSRPRYDEIDPTLFIGPIIIIYFALMLGDAVYGLLILMIGTLLYRGAGRVSRSVRDMSIILMVAGMATVVSGVLQGSYVGDFLPRFLGITPGFVLLNPLENPIVFLQMALIVGIIHINLGLVIAVYQNMRRKNYRDILHDQISWFIIQPSAAILLFDFFGWAEAAMPLKMTACAGALIGTSLLMIKEGPLGIFSLTGFLGDWLSYTRLLALALATGGIAMTVNILAEMVAGIHPALLIFAALIFILGQTFNFVLQSLGAFVHSLRLQFVEFFGKFYVGGGREFEAFEVRRVITELVEGDQ